ncbi:MAG: hypothetical protein C0407_06675 [Desulfobacca sp.]|nr:hypothetical protein [Desulfobacca sp.]
MVLLIGLIGTAANFSCTSSSGSSSSSGSGTGAGWTVTVSATPSSASTSNGETLGIVALVKDRNGTPAVKGTNVCISALRGGFVNLASTDRLVLVTICSATTNDIGQAQATYTPLKVMSIETPSGSGTYQNFNVSISPGTDTITATGMGASGSTVVQVLP